MRGTVRDKENMKKLGPIKKGLGELWDQLEIVDADLNNPESFKEAIKGSTYVVHTA